MPVTNEGRFSARYSQYEPFLSPTGVSVTPYTDAPPVTPHTSLYSASALGAGTGAAAAVTRVPFGMKVPSSSVMSRMARRVSATLERCELVGTYGRKS